MNGKEAIEAFLKRVPVLCTHITLTTEYKYISALIYKLVNGQIKLTVELMDYNERAVFQVDPKYIKLKKEGV